MHVAKSEGIGRDDATQDEDDDVREASRVRSYRST